MITRDYFGCDYNVFEIVTDKTSLMIGGTNFLFCLTTKTGMSQQIKFRYQEIKHSHAAPPPETEDCPLPVTTFD